MLKLHIRQGFYMAYDKPLGIVYYNGPQIQVFSATQDQKNSICGLSVTWGKIEGRCEMRKTAPEDYYFRRLEHTS